MPAWRGRITMTRDATVDRAMVSLRALFPAVHDPELAFFVREWLCHAWRMSKLESETNNRYRIMAHVLRSPSQITGL